MFSKKSLEEKETKRAQIIKVTALIFSKDQYGSTNHQRRVFINFSWKYIYNLSKTEEFYTYHVNMYF